MPIIVKTDGPLFKGRINVSAVAREAMTRTTRKAADVARTILGERSRYRTAKYGHVADNVRTQVREESGTFFGRAYVGGPPGFVARFLEFGTRAHPIPSLRIRGGSNRRTLHRKDTVLAFPAGGGMVFRASANHPGTRAYRWATRAQEEMERFAPQIFEQTLKETLES